MKRRSERQTEMLRTDKNGRGITATDSQLGDKGVGEEEEDNLCY